MISYTRATNDGGNWLSYAGSEGSTIGNPLKPAGSETLTVTADAKGLQASTGLFKGTVTATITTQSGQKASIAITVTFTVTATGISPAILKQGRSLALLWLDTQQWP